MVRRRPSSTRAARARSEESDRDPVDGSSPAERTVTDRRAFVVVRTQTHNNSEKLHCFFVCSSMCHFSGEWNEMLKTRAGPGRRRCPARARSRRDEATRRTVDGSEGDGRPASIFFVCACAASSSVVTVVRSPRGTFDRSFARARARVCAMPARESPARRRRRATRSDGGDREVRSRFPRTDRGGERGGGARALVEAKRRVRELEEMHHMVE